MPKPPPPNTTSIEPPPSATWKGSTRRVARPGIRLKAQADKDVDALKTALEAFTKAVGH